MDEEVARYRQMALAVSTKKSYSSYLKSYMSFCIKMNYCPVPIDQNNLLRYTAYLAQRLSPQSIPAYLSVIRFLHLDSNMSNPVANNFGLDMLLKGIKRNKGVIIKQALPITPQLLLGIRNLLDLSAPYWACFWAACLVGFFAFLRKSNLFYNTDNDHFLKRDQVVVNYSGQVVLRLNSTKTIQFKQRTVNLPLPEIINHPLCPVSALRNMFDLCPPQEGSSPVFMFLTPGGAKPLQYNQFIKDLKKLLGRLGRTSGYSGHSFRRGGASYLLSIGIPGELIKLMGDWHSDAYQKYIDVSLDTRASIVSRVALCLPRTL